MSHTLLFTRLLCGAFWFSAQAAGCSNLKNSEPNHRTGQQHEQNTKGVSIRSSTGQQGWPALVDAAGSPGAGNCTEPGSVQVHPAPASACAHAAAPVRPAPARLHACAWLRVCSCGLCSCGLCSCGLCSCGLCSCGLCPWLTSVARVRCACACALRVLSTVFAALIKGFKADKGCCKPWGGIVQSAASGSNAARQTPTSAR